MRKAAFFMTGAALGTISYFAYKGFGETFNKNTSDEEYLEDNENQNTQAVDENRKYSIIFIIRKDLKMRNGKISAQVGHASLGIFLKIQKHYPNLSEYNFEKELYYCPNEKVQNQKMILAKQNGLCTYLIHDQGRTQIASGSATVLAIAPVEADFINVFTEGLTVIPKK